MGGAPVPFGPAELMPAGDAGASDISGGPAAPGGVPYATNPLRHFAGYTDIGSGVVPTPMPKPSLGARIGVSAASAAAGALGGPVFGLLARVIGNSLMRTGSLDNAQPYRGAIQGTQYATATPNSYGAGYSTGSSYSASPFTPSGSGWHAPSFSPVSGGPLYSYNPETHTYIDSRGNAHSYEPG
jgi:hypothetical protein